MEAPVAVNVIPTVPAEPLLASQVISDEELDGLVDSVCYASIGKSKNQKNKLRTDVKSLDDALGGGLESARVVCVSGEAAVGASEVSNNGAMDMRTPARLSQEAE